MANINELMLEMDVLEIAEGMKKHGNCKHGLVGTKIYTVWRNMKTRCLNPKCSIYEYYGLRGITICDEWKNDPEAFYEWSIANGYSDNLQIDRINNDGNYEPSNCRFVTPIVNMRNRRSQKKLSTLPEGVYNANSKNNTFVAQITMYGKLVCLGTWSTPSEASKQFQCVRRIYQLASV